MREKREAGEEAGQLFRMEVPPKKPPSSLTRAGYTEKRQEESSENEKNKQDAVLIKGYMQRYSHFHRNVSGTKYRQKQGGKDCGSRAESCTVYSTFSLGTTQIYQLMFYLADTSDVWKVPD